MSLTRIGSIGINTGIAFAGVTTIVTLNTANDALSIGATVNVGSGITLGASGDIFATGIVTATSFVGSGANLTGVASTENIRTNTNATFLQNVTVVGTSTVTGNIVPSSDSATDIGTNSVRFQNAYVDTYYGSGANLTGIDTELVNDTSPQLGGNLDVNTKNIVFGDSGGATDDRLTFGAGTDLSIYHDGTHSYVVNTVGNLRIQNNGTVKTAQFEVDTIDFNDSANSEVRVRINSDGLSLVQDNDKVQIGASQDLSLYHDGTNSYIASNQGELRLTGANGTIRIRPTTAEDSIVAAPNAGVELYHDNTLKFGTDSAGVYARGDMMLNYADDYKIKMGAGNDFQLYHDGSYNYILSPNAHPLIQESDEIQLRAVNNEKYFKGVVNGAVELYYDHTKRLQTTANGLTILGQTQIDGNCFPYSDNNNDLGLSANRWQDLYLSGNIYLGGTGSANALDDYEEGTFSLSVAAGGFTSINGTGTYTKIGRICHFTGDFSLQGSGNGDTLRMSGLPFNSYGDWQACSGYFQNYNNEGSQQASPAVVGGTNEFRVVEYGNEAPGNAFGAGYMNLTGTYLTND